MIAGLLLFVKPNYFAAVVLAILLRLIVSRFQLRWAAGLAGGFLIVAAAGFWWLGFQFAAFLADLRLLGSVQTLSLRIASVFQLAAANLPDLWFLGSAMLIALPCAGRAGMSFIGMRRIAAPPIALAALGILTCSANYQGLQIPLIYLAIFLLVEQVRRMDSDRGNYGRVCFLGISLLAAGATAKPVFDDVATLLATGAKITGTTEPSASDWPRFDAAALRDLTLEPPAWNIPTASILGGLRAGATEWREEAGGAYPYVLWFNAGGALLRDRLSAQPRVLVMDLSNPFSFALGLTPPTGDALFWHFERDFNLKHYPDPSRVFQTVTDVMIPKTPIHRAATEALRRIYAPVLERDFAAAENDL